jgi:hypothetical protein
MCSKETTMTSVRRDNPDIPPPGTTANDQGSSYMQRLKSTGTSTPPRPVGCWLAGVMIGSAIMTMATQAMILGTGTAIADATLKRR